jgi:hypothetical protein
MTIAIGLLEDLRKEDGYNVKQIITNPVGMKILG